MSDATHSAEAEESVIGCLLLESKCLHTFDLEACEFYLPPTRFAYEAIVALVHDLGQPVDTLTVHDELVRRGRSIPTLEQLGEWASRVPTSANAWSYAKRVREYAAKRRLVQTTTKLQQMATDCDPAEVPSTAESMQSALSKAADQRSQIVPIRVALDEAFECIDEDEAAPTILPTGMGALDGLIGGLPVGSITVIAGRPSQGKSSLSRIIAHNVAARGDPVGYVTLEESKAQLSMNLAIWKGLVDSEHVTKRALSKAERARLAQARMDLNSLPLHITDDRPLTGEQACARLRQMRAQFGIKLAIVDYWNRLSLPGRRPMREEANTLVNLFSALARELKIPLVVVAQLNRESEREARKPRLSDLKESGGWEESAWVVVLCHRDGFYKDSEPQDEIDLIVAKSKTTRTGRRLASWCGKYLWVGDKMPRDPDAKEQRRMPYGDA